MNEMQIEQDGARFYIPLSPRWEVQTKGNGSSFRIAERKNDGHRMLVPESPYLHDFIERMAREVNADYVALAERIAQLEESEAEYRRRTDPLLDKLEELSAERDTAQSELAAARKDADSARSEVCGKYLYFKQRFGPAHQTTRALSELIDRIDAARTHEAQDEGKNCG